MPVAEKLALILKLWSFGNERGLLHRIFRDDMVYGVYNMSTMDQFSEGHSLFALELKTGFLSLIRL